MKTSWDYDPDEFVGSDGTNKPFEHTESCKRFQDQLKAAHNAWVARWPDYCRACEGYGETKYIYDPSPAGVSLAAGTMEDAEPCPCTMTGHCPRCGRYHARWDETDWEDEVIKCDCCGWVYGKTEGCPPEADECGCYDILIDELVGGGVR